MSTRVGAPTKGLIKNNTTGAIQRFQFNPSSITYPRSVSYATVDAPGMAYPDTQYVKGEAREFSVNLPFFDKPYSGLYITMCNFFGAFLTPETNTPGYTKPPEMTFVMGSFTRVCVMLSLEINIVQYDGNLNPVHFEFNVTLRQVGV